VIIIKELFTNYYLANTYFFTTKLFNGNYVTITKESFINIYIIITKEIFIVNINDFLPTNTLSSPNNCQIYHHNNQIFHHYLGIVYQNSASSESFTNIIIDKEQPTNNYEIPRYLFINNYENCSTIAMT